MNKYLLRKVNNNREVVPKVIHFQITEVFQLHTFRYLRILKLFPLYQNEFVHGQPLKMISRVNITNLNIIMEGILTSSSVLGIEVNV